MFQYSVKLVEKTNSPLSIFLTAFHVIEVNVSACVPSFLGIIEEITVCPCCIVRWRSEHTVNTIAFYVLPHCNKAVLTIYYVCIH